MKAVGQAITETDENQRIAGEVGGGKVAPCSQNGALPGRPEIMAVRAKTLWVTTCQQLSRDLEFQCHVTLEEKRSKVLRRDQCTTFLDMRCT